MAGGRIPDFRFLNSGNLLMKMNINEDTRTNKDRFFKLFEINFFLIIVEITI